MKKRSYLVVWWMARAPHAAQFDDRVSAEEAASVRNALMITLSDRDAQVDSVRDWNRRTGRGNRCLRNGGTSSAKSAWPGPLEVPGALPLEHVTKPFSAFHRRTLFYRARMRRMGLR